MDFLNSLVTQNFLSLYMYKLLETASVTKTNFLCANIFDNKASDSDMQNQQFQLQVMQHTGSEHAGALWKCLEMLSYPPIM